MASSRPLGDRSTTRGNRNVIGEFQQSFSATWLLFNIPTMSWKKDEKGGRYVFLVLSCFVLMLHLEWCFSLVGDLSMNLAEIVDGIIP